MSQMSPKRTKFRKQQKGKNRGLAWRGSDVSFGDFALQAVGGSFLSSRQIEAGRMAIQRHVKRAGNSATEPVGVKQDIACSGASCLPNSRPLSAKVPDGR